jgi:uncharacterized membrane protein YjjB (DUF3815 family)
MNVALVVSYTTCGAIAAAGFGVLFNAGFRALPWCAASGALALAVRSCCLAWGWNLEGASFAAALTVGAAVHLLQRYEVISQNVLNVVGCIPMIPGSFAAKAIIGLFVVSTSTVANESETLITAAQYTLRVLFTIGAIGTGLAIPNLVLRMRTAVN